MGEDDNQFLTTTNSPTSSKDGEGSDPEVRHRRRLEQGPSSHTHHPQATHLRRKGLLSKRTAFVREIVKEVAGLAPYERRVIELLRNSKDKRARKLAKKRLGTFGRAKRKVDDLQRVIAESRRTGAH